MFEHELAGVTGPVSSLRAAVAMRSAGQVLAVRLLDRQMWACQHTDNVRTHYSDSSSYSISSRISSNSTGRPLTFACPLFHEFRELNKTAKINGTNIDTNLCKL